MPDWLRPRKSTTAIAPLVPFIWREVLKQNQIWSETAMNGIVGSLITIKSIRRRLLILNRRSHRNCPAYFSRLNHNCAPHDI
jgi:hypothetical protein